MELKSNNKKKMQTKKKLSKINEAVFVVFWFSILFSLKHYHPCVRVDFWACHLHSWRIVRMHHARTHWIWMVMVDVLLLKIKNPVEYPISHRGQCLPHGISCETWNRHRKPSFPPRVHLPPRDQRTLTVQVSNIRGEFQFARNANKAHIEPERVSLPN